MVCAKVAASWSRITSIVGRSPPANSSLICPVAGSIKSFKATILLALCNATGSSIVAGSGIGSVNTRSPVAGSIVELH